MVRQIITHGIAVYLGAGLSLGLIMQQAVPLSNFGVGVYAATWPRHVYCARPGADCFGQADYLPIWFGKLMFKASAFKPKEPTP